jgi:hypothetical protein
MLIRYNFIYTIQPWYYWGICQGNRYLSAL